MNPLRHKYKTLRLARARLAKAFEAALWRRKGWTPGEIINPETGQREWIGNGPHKGKRRRQIIEPGTRGRRQPAGPLQRQVDPQAQETIPVSDERTPVARPTPVNPPPPIRGARRTVSSFNPRYGDVTRETLIPAGVKRSDAWQRTDDPELFLELMKRPAVMKQLRGPTAVHILCKAAHGATITRNGPWELFSELAKLANGGVRSDKKLLAQQQRKVYGMAREARMQRWSNPIQQVVNAIVHMTQPRGSAGEAVLDLLIGSCWSRDDTWPETVINAIRGELPNPFIRTAGKTPPV